MIYLCHVILLLKNNFLKISDLDEIKFNQSTKHGCKKNYKTLQ